MDFNEVALGLANAVKSVPGITPLDYVPDALPEPVFMVGELDIEYDKTFGRGSDEVMVTCRVMVARGTDREGQRKLRMFMAGSGLRSIKQAIEADRSLGGACDSLRVERSRGNRLFVVGEARYYGAEIDVYIIGDGV